MGLNFIIGCHKCSEQLWMWRGEESDGIHSFFRRHESCYRSDPRNLAFADDQVTEPAWSETYVDIGAKEQVT